MRDFRDGEPGRKPTPPSPDKGSFPDSVRLEQLGDLHFEASAYSSAIEYYRSALELESSKSAAASRAAHFHRRIADSLRHQGLFEEAHLELDRCEELVKGGPREDIAVVHVRRAQVLQQQARYSAAIRLAQGAFAALAGTDRHREVGLVQMVLGICHGALGRREKAEEFFRDALSTYRRIEDGRSQAHVYNNLAILAKASCRWNRALRFYDRAEELLERNGATYEFSWLYLNKAILYRKMGNHAEAMAYAQRGLRLTQNLGSQIRLARHKLLLGQLLIDEGHADEAERSLLEARVLAERGGALREQALADEFMGDLMVSTGRHDEALSNYESAESLARGISDHNDILAEIYSRRASLLLVLDRPDVALNTAEIGLGMVEACGEEFERGTLERAKASALQRLSRLAEAEVAFEAAVHSFRRQRRGAETVRTLRQLAEFHLQQGGHDHLLQAKARLQDALELSYSESTTARCQLHLLSGRVELALGNCDEALLCLFEVERLDGCGCGRFESDMLDLRTQIEQAMAERAQDMSARYRLLADLPDLLAEGEGPHGIESVLTATAERLGAQRGFVAVRDVEAKRTRVLARWNLLSKEARALAERALQLEIEGEQPRVFTQASGDAAWHRLEVGAPRDRAVIFPLARDGQLMGVVYLDADGGPDGFALDGEALAMASTYVQIVRSTVLAGVERDGARVPDPAVEAMYEHLITQSQCMQEVLELCAKVAPSPYTVLFTGETGTGKGLLARIVHELSPRRSHPLVLVNCAAIPDNLLESELFGYLKGAFTGAESNREGLIFSAQKGTLFLDEIGKMSLPMQAKLLHFLDSKEVRPVGGTQSRRADVRVLCATRRDLRSMVDHDEFLEDLYYRLLDFPIHVPPLRARPEDIELLARHFAKIAATETVRSAPGLSRGFLARLEHHSWPGNVRELEKVIRRAVVMAAGDAKLREKHLPAGFARTHELGSGVDARGPLKQQVAALERRAVQAALEKSGWNRSQAARELQISYPTLLQKIRAYGLRPS